MHVRWHILLLVTVPAMAVSIWASSGFAASEYVVVAVDPPAGTPALGSLYRLGDLLHVDRGATITLMGDDGSVRAVAGPADIVLTDDASDASSTSGEPAEGSSKLAQLADLLAVAEIQVHTIGGSRGISAQAQADLEPWSVPVEDGVFGCIRDRKLELWRAPGTRAAVYISYDNKPIVLGLIWDADRSRLTVPGTVPANAESVVVGIDDKSYRLTLKHLPSDVRQHDHLGLYAWMVGNACFVQASALIRRLAGQNAP